MELILFIGIQAIGKSTFYKEMFFDSHLRLNLDMLKTRNRERILFEAALESKTKIVIDNTNPCAADRAWYIRLAKENRYSITAYYFAADVSMALEQNESRERVVPKVAILGTYKKLELPAYEEGFDKLFYVQPQGGTFSIEDWKK